MPEEYTQVQAYKHLLEVAENIIYSVDTQQPILYKYEQLKKSVMRKILPITPSSSSNQHYVNLLSIYRLIIDNTIKTISKFQQQLENQMQRKNYNQIVITLNDSVVGKIQEVQRNLQRLTGEKSKTKLLNKQEINSLKYQYDQLDAKFQNLGLLIEVHKKMHEIILEATQAQKRRTKIDQNYKERIKSLERHIQKIGDVQQFVNQHKITEEKYRQYKIAAKALSKVLFSQK